MNLIRRITGVFLSPFRSVSHAKPLQYVVTGDAKEARLVGTVPKAKVSAKNQSLLQFLGDIRNPATRNERVGKTFEIVSNRPMGYHGRMMFLIEGFLPKANPSHWVLKSYSDKEIQDKRAAGKLEARERSPAYPNVVFHTASSRNNIMDIDFNHSTRFAMIGYHYVITQEGVIINTRPIAVKGSHAYGYNDAIGICFEKNLNRFPLSSAEINAAKALLDITPHQRIFGHNTAALEAVRFRIAAYAEEKLKDKAFEKTEAENAKSEIEHLQEERHKGKLHGKGRMLSSLETTKKFLKKHMDLKIGRSPLYTYLFQLKDCPGTKCDLQLLGAK